MNLSVSCSNDEADEQDGVLVLKKKKLTWSDLGQLQWDRTPSILPSFFQSPVFHPHSLWHAKAGSQTKLDIPGSRTKEASILSHCLLPLSPATQWKTNKCLKILQPILPNMTPQHRCSGVLEVYNVRKTSVYFLLWRTLIGKVAACVYVCKEISECDITPGKMETFSWNTCETQRNKVHQV